MKISLLSLLGVLIGTLAIAQSSSDAHWLVMKYGEDGEAILAAGGEKLSMYEFLNSEAWSIGDAGPKDLSEYPDALLVNPVIENAPVLSVDSFLAGQVNLEWYGFERHGELATYYRLGNTQYLLIVQSFAEARAKFLNGQ